LWWHGGVKSDEALMDTTSLIMVVDDQPEVLEVLRMMLEYEGGHQVMTATNGRHALERLEAALRRQREGGGRHLPDLIVSDILMPVMDGYDFYEATRSNPYLSHIPFLFLTAVQDEEDIRRGKALGVDDYLLKPIQTQDLLATVQGKLRRVSQRRALAAQATGNVDKPSAAGVILLLILIAIVVFVTVIVTLILVT
jgi:CheY-like chemotaxis protein